MAKKAVEPEVKKKPLTPAEKKILAGQIDRLGEVQKQLQEVRLKHAPTFLKLQEKVAQAQALLTADSAALVEEESELFPLIEEAIEPKGSLSGASYKAESVETRAVRELDNPKVLKKIGQKKWNEISTVTLKELGKLLGLEELDAVTKGYKRSYSVTIHPIA